MIQLTFNGILILVAAVALAGCASSAPDERIGFEQARKMFAERGVQPGQPLPKLSLLDMNGNPASLKELQGDRPLVLVTCSLTCNVARRQQPDVDAIRKHYGNGVAVVMVYTIDAHPKGDPCPYTGKEWVPKDNEKDKVLVTQPRDMQDRLKAARDFQRRFSSGAIMLVDTMDDQSWEVLGSAPNLGLLIDRSGIVRLRQGWFDRPAMEKAIEGMGVMLIAG